jgi:DNA-binding NarL/FixJ family response regulator
MTEQLDVLIVDDVPMIRENVSTLIALSPDVARVRTAGDGFEAIDAVRTALPDVIVMDIRMPRMDGIEAARAIRERFPTVGIVFHSAYEDESLLAEAAGIDAEAYFVKGSPVRELATLITAAAVAARARGALVVPSRA